VLKYNGTAWTPAAETTTTVEDVLTSTDASHALSANQGKVLNDGKLDKTATFAGDVTGTYGDNTVAKIQGVEVAATTPTANQVLTYNTTSSKWTPATFDLGVFPFVKTTTNYTIKLTDYTVVLKGASANANFTLPTADVAGRTFRIINLSEYNIILSQTVKTAVDLTTNKILSGNAIDGTTLGNKMTIQWDGDEWIQVGN